MFSVSTYFYLWIGTGRSAQRGFEVGAEDGRQHGVGDPRVAVSLHPVANCGVVRQAIRTSLGLANP